VGREACKAVEANPRNRDNCIGRRYIPRSVLLDQEELEMRGSLCAVALLTLVTCGVTRAQEVAPVKLSLEPPEPSVYALPEAPRPEEGINQGGANIDIKVTYLSDYIYRGVNRSDFIGDVTGRASQSRANFQFDGKLEFNLGKFPHPFIGIFANVLDSDPISNFQEVRPYFGMEWRIRPFIFEVGNNIYSFPDRRELNTGEVYGKITLDDSVILRRDERLLSPYIYAAYDYDNYNGWYFEAGVSHDFVIEKTGITITAVADLAYVLGHGAFVGPTGRDTGFQHYEVGLVGRYSLNELLNIPQRFGRWSLNGYVYYTDGIADNLRASTGVWGGAGIEWTY
jgi:hypothetical protein